MIFPSKNDTTNIAKRHQLGIVSYATHRMSGISISINKSLDPNVRLRVLSAADFRHGFSCRSALAAIDIYIVLGYSRVYKTL